MIKSSSSTKILYLVKKSLTKLLSKVKTASTRINSQPLRIASIFVLRPITIPKAPNKIDLPGGDHKFTTKDDTTLKAIDKILNNLNINGYVAIVMYPGHEEGLKEYQSIKLFVKDLPKKSFTVGWYKMINHNFNAPALCWIEKVGEYA